MKQVTMYKCSCGELGTELQIKKCEARHVKWAAENKERINFFKRISTFKTKLRKTASSIQEIETKIIEFSKKISPNFYIEEIQLQKMNWDNHCSNSQGCPIGGVINWGSNQGKPTGYPGYRGRVWFKMNKSHWDVGSKEHLKHRTGSDYIQLFLACYIGSGGSSHNDGYSYDLTIWADDFPELSKGYEQSQINSKSFADQVSLINKNMIDEANDDTILNSIKESIKNKYSEIEAIEENIAFMKEAANSHIDDVIFSKYQIEYDKTLEDINKKGGIGFNYPIAKLSKPKV